MKGMQFAVLALFWVIAVAMIFIVGDFGLRIGTGKIQEALIKTDVYMMSSAMDAAQSYLGAALQYSNYQACYELLKNGGNGALTDTNRISHEGKDYGIVPERQNFVSSLKDKLQENLNAYAAMGYSFARDYSVKLPDFAVTLADDGASASAAADKKMSSQKDVKGGNLDPAKSNVNGKVTIYRTANMDAKLRLNCLPYFDKMREASDETKAVMANILQDGIDRVTAGVIKDSGTDCENVKSDEEAAAKKAVAELSGDDKAAEALQLEMKVTLITPIEPEKEGPNKGKYVCRFASDGVSSATAKVSIRGSDSVPVWNGEKIKYEPLDAVFAAGVDSGIYYSCISYENSQTMIACKNYCTTDEYSFSSFQSLTECMNSLDKIRTEFLSPSGHKSVSVSLPPESGQTEGSQALFTEPEKFDDTMNVYYSQPDWPECKGVPAPCGPTAIYECMKKLGMNPDICEINDKRKPSTFSLRRIMSLFNSEALGITWPSQIKSILEGYGLNVVSKTILLNSRESLEEYSLRALDEGKSVIWRISLDPSRKLVTQHYECINKEDIALKKEYHMPLHEIYIISAKA